MTTISIQKNDTYDKAALAASIDAHFSALGIDADIRPDMNVVIKPNLLSSRKPENAVTTHPAVVEAIVDWLRARGVTKIIIADSPGGTYKKAALRAIYDACSYLPLEGKATLNYDLGYQAVSCPPGFQNEGFNLIDPIIHADYIINVAKLKTHGLTTISAGVKNLFGAVPGLQKPEWHFKKPQLDDFCRMLIELAQTVGPQVTVIDAVQTMEGDGPMNGRVRHMGHTLASRNAFALDVFAAQLMGFEPDTIPMLAQSIQLKLCEPERVTVVGDVPPPADPPYRLPESIGQGNNHRFILRVIQGIAKRVYRAIPCVEDQKCVGCGKCAESCPMQIIEIAERKAKITTKHCISCFCCQEMCQFDAIRVRHVLRLPKI